MHARLRSLLLAAFLFAGASTSVSAQSGHALAFHPFQGSEVNVPLSTPGGPFTLEAWVRAFSDPEVYGYFTIMEFGDNRPYFGIIGNALGVEGVVRAESPLPTGTWQHVAYSYDGTTSRLYLNGTEIASNTTAPPREGAALGIGHGIGDTAWHGYIDEVIVWNRARTAAEITSDMGGLSAVEIADADLLAYYRFDEGMGQVAYNAKAGGPNGTLGPSTAVEINDPVWIVVTSSSERETPHSSGLRLSEARPNPVGSRVGLTLEVSRTQPVHVAVYDALGRAVSVLYDGLVAAGTAEALTFDAGALPNGMYFVRAVGEEGITSRSLAILR